MAVLTHVHQRRVVRGCPVCGERHTHLEAMELLRPNSPDARGWVAPRPTITRPLLTEEQKVNLQRQVRIHSQNPLERTRCIAPKCNDRYPCSYRRGAEARLLEAGVEPWRPR